MKDNMVIDAERLQILLPVQKQEALWERFDSRPREYRWNNICISFLIFR